MPKFITKNALAEGLGVDYETLTEWEGMGFPLPTANELGNELYDMAAIKAWLEAEEMGNAHELTKDLVKRLRRNVDDDPNA